MNRNLACAFVMSLLSYGQVVAQEARQRTSVQTKGDAWVGQEVTLVVEVLAPGYFTGNPTFDLPKISGVLIFPPVSAPVIGTETIEGVSYTVQRHELTVISRRAGEIAIPSFTARFGMKRAPLDKDAIEQSIATTTVRFQAKQPPGTEGMSELISSKELSLEETWKPVPGSKAKAGDAFVRTLVWSADDVPGMAFPEFPVQKIEGVGVYADDPVVVDHSERGQSHGARTDQVTYVCELGGRVTIPAIRMSWWDIDDQVLRSIDLPERIMEVEGKPAPAAAAVAEVHSGDVRSILIAVLLAPILGYVIWKISALWKPLLIPLFPHHLSPLNPSTQSKS